MVFCISNFLLLFFELTQKFDDATELTQNFAPKN